MITGQTPLIFQTPLTFFKWILTKMLDLDLCDKYKHKVIYYYYQYKLL